MIGYYLHSKTDTELWCASADANKLLQMDADKAIIGNKQEAVAILEQRHPVDPPLTLVVIQQGNSSIRVLAEPIWDGRNVQELIELLKQGKAPRILENGRIPGHVMDAIRESGYAIDWNRDSDDNAYKLKRIRTRKPKQPEVTILTAIGCFLHKSRDIFREYGIAFDYASRPYHRAIESLLDAITLFDTLHGQGAHLKLPEFQQICRHWDVKRLPSGTRKHDKRNVAWISRQVKRKPGRGKLKPSRIVSRPSVRNRQPAAKIRNMLNTLTSKAHAINNQSSGW